MKRHRSPLSLIALLAVLLISCSERREEPRTVSANDTEMKAAMEKARQTFAVFVEEGRRRPDFGGQIKVRFTEGGNTEEYLWVKTIDFSRSDMTGVLVDTPTLVKNVKAGDFVTFSLKDVGDWLFVREGKAVGVFSLRLFRNRMNDSERRKFDSGYSFSFE